MATPTSGPYTGPSVREMFQTHTLAKEIIARANDPWPVLDSNELALLKSFCFCDVTDSVVKKQILKDANLEEQLSQEPGERPKTSGSLIGYIIAESVAGKEMLTDEEVGLLREWFTRG